MTDDPADRVRLVSHRRALLSRPDAHTDAEPLGVGVRGLVSATGIALQGLVRFVYSVLVGRLLPAGFLASVNSAISTAMLATLMWPTSIGAAAAKFLAREAGDVEVRAGLTRHLARLSVLTSVALGVVAGGVTLLWLQPGEVVTGVLVGLLTIGWSGYTFVRGVQYATGRVLRATVWDGLSFVAAVAGLVLVLVFDLRAWLLLPLAAGYLLYTLAGWPRTGRGVVPPALRAEINRFVAWGVLGSLATGGFLQLTMVLAEQTGDVASADAYAAALTLATPAAMLGSVLSLLLLPALSGAVGRGDLALARKTTDLAHRGLIGSIGGVFGVLIVGGDLLVALIWPKLSAAVPVLQILLVATFLLTAGTVVTEAIQSATAHGARVIAVIRASGFVVGLALALALVPSLSVIGIAIGYLAGMAVIGTASTVVVWRRDSHTWAPLMLRVAAGAALAGALVWALSTRPTGWLDAVAVAVFALGWALLHRKDLLAVTRRS